MKLLGYLLAFYILFLSVQPGIAAMSSLSDNVASCSTACGPNENEQSGEEENSCNPFLFCKCCAVVSAIPVPRGFQLETDLFRSYTEQKEKIPAQLAPDFWQPPKIA